MGRLGERQGPEEYGVDDAEHRGVHADAQGQGQDRDRCETGRSKQAPRGDDQILDELLTPVGASFGVQAVGVPFSAPFFMISPLSVGSVL